MASFIAAAKKSLNLPFGVAYFCESERDTMTTAQSSPLLSTLHTIYIPGMRIRDPSESTRRNETERNCKTVHSNVYAFISIIIRHFFRPLVVDVKSFIKQIFFLPFSSERKTDRKQPRELHRNLTGSSSEF